MPPSREATAPQPPPEKSEKPVTVLVTGFGVSLYFNLSAAMF